MACFTISLKQEDKPGEAMPGTEVFAGMEVEARGLRWQVVNVSEQDGKRQCRLRGLGGALLGEEIELALDAEPVSPVNRIIDPAKAGRLREWLPYHQAFLLEQALGPRALLAAQPGRINIEPYQLVPVVRALALSRVRLMLADGVGLGKTIQAGLIIAELVARRLAHRILIVSPAGPLLEQWRAEMRDRFGLRLNVIDRAALEEERRKAELGANPFDHITLGLASIDFLKQERVLSELERTAYDIVIVDEAHHCAEAGSGATADDSQRRRLAKVLARNCDALLLLTATPHDGNDSSFASLCELLDPSLVDGSGRLREARYRRHLVRRLKRHVLDTQTRQPLFPEREVYPARVMVDPAQNPAFAALIRKLLAFVAPEFRRALRDRNFSDVLSFFALLKRSVSTVDACRTTLIAVRDRLRATLEGADEDQQARRERVRTLRELRKRLERFGANSAEEEAELQEIELEDIVQRLADLEREFRRESRSAGRTESRIDSLNELISLAEQALPTDPKLLELARLVGEIRAAEPNANVLVYTEYTTSQAVAATALASAGLKVLTLSGQDDDKQRIEKTERFRNEDDLVMVCTDAAAEGLNLHKRCHHLIHLELPFNPNRLEQRNGRIDRYGQKHTPIVRYLYLARTFEQNILLRLIAKYERQRQALTFMPNTLGVTADEGLTASRLLRGVVEGEATLFAGNDSEVSFDASDPAVGADDGTRELLEEIDRSFQHFEQAARTNSWLGTEGSYADDEVVQSADQAKRAGEQSLQVDLASFVLDALRMDGAAITGAATDSWFSVRLPANWALPLQDTPGADAATRVVRLTTNKDVVVVEDAGARHLVGYLGRAHPLVRFAIDRVRFSSMGGQSHQLDARATAVKGAVSHPTLFCTFLARVHSDDGREVERVVAVRLTSAGEPVWCATPDTWLAHANNAIDPTGVWERDFAAWAPAKREAARSLALESFTREAESILEELRQTVRRENDDLNRWLEERAAEFAPSNDTLQRDIFDTGQTTPQRTPVPTDPRGRIEYFSKAAGLTPTQRNEAAAVLKTYTERAQRLERRARLHPPEIREIGLLMVVPEARHGA